MVLDRELVIEVYFILHFISRCEEKPKLNYQRRRRQHKRNYALVNLGWQVVSTGGRGKERKKEKGGGKTFRISAVNKKIAIQLLVLPAGFEVVKQHLNWSLKSEM